MNNQEFQDISFKLEPSIIRVKSDAALKKYMTARISNAYRLARYIKDCYYRAYNKPLRITTRSLAVEFWAHFTVQQAVFFKDKVTDRTIHRRIMARISDKLLLHTDVIDCGEIHTDNNRFVWDLLSLSIPESKKKLRAMAEQEKDHSL